MVRVRAIHLSYTTAVLVTAAGLLLLSSETPVGNSEENDNAATTDNTRIDVGKCNVACLQKIGNNKTDGVKIESHLGDYFCGLYIRTVCIH